MCMGVTHPLRRVTAACLMTVLGLAAVETGAWSDLEPVVFTGTGPFQPAAVRRALLSDRSLLLALHPRSPWERSRAALIATLEHGYRAQGFPDVTILVPEELPREGALRIAIDPGMRFHSGELHVGGVDQELGGLIEAHLLQRRDQDSGLPLGADEQRTGLGALWPLENGAPFHEGGLEPIRMQVRQALRRGGRYDARFGVRLRRDPEAAVAHLEVEIADPGRAITCAAIVVQGLERSSRAAVLERIPVAIGVPLSETLLRESERALRLSGSFLSVTVQRSEEPADEVLIQVEEDPALPSLDAEPDPVQQALLQLARWIQTEATAGDWEYGWNLRLGTGQLDGRIAPGHGLELLQRDDGPRLRYLRGQVLWQAGGQEPLASPHALRGLVSLSFGAHAADAEGNTRQMSMSAGFSTAGDGEGPLVIDLDVAAAALLLENTSETMHLQETDAGVVLEHAAGDGSLRVGIDADTGRLLELHMRGEDVDFRLHSQALVPEQWQAVDGVETVAGAVIWQHLVDTAEGQLLTLAPDPDTQAGLAAALQAIARLPALFTALVGELHLVGTDDDKERFTIPDRLELGGDALTRFIVAAMPVAYRVGLQMAPYDHWIPTILREATRLLSGESRYLQQEVRRLYNDDRLGPVGSTILALLVRRMDQTVAEVLAERARERSSARHFHEEFAPVFAQIGPGLETMLDQIASLEDLPDLASLVEQPEQRQQTRAALERLQTWAAAPRSGEPDTAQLAELLWQAGIDRLVAEAVAGGFPDF
ncbi:MAG: hypothetical protein ACOCXJ_02410 [Planctomycetota bacterium]